jgi:ATP-dependent phosphofructokinase / diphosphate-dependent phosphofructokinase
MSQYIGILTSGGDCPGLNAAIRGVGKAAQDHFGMEMVGFRDGFRGLVQDRTMPLDPQMLSGILTDGGTILGTSRDKPHKMPIGGKTLDMTDVIVDTYQRHHLDALVCLGGGGTQKNALRLKRAGLNVVTLPKTIDNDVAMTDMTFGFDTALQTATEAIDRLHSTATSHHRVIVVELMGHRAGWLALGAGIAGGADVILIPEIPYSVDVVADAIKSRLRKGKRFSIVAVAEGAMTLELADEVARLVKQKEHADSKDDKAAASARLSEIYNEHVNHTLRLTELLEERAGIESRLTILGHLQRGGTPSAADRILATRLGTACARLLNEKVYGVMVAAQGDDVAAIPLEEVAGRKKLVEPDHAWVRTARMVGTCLGDA